MQILQRSSDIAKWYDSITIMVLENTGWSSVQDTKFFNYFKENWLICSNYTGIGHPSGPNYRAWLSGNNWSWNEFDGVKRPNIADLVDYKIFDWAGMPAIRHDPFLDMNPDDIHADNHFSRNDYTIANLASINYLGLDDQNNAHSAPLNIADNNVMEAIKCFETILAYQTDNRRKLFVLIFDEGYGIDYISNHVFAGFAGTGIAPQGTITTRLNHFNMAQFIADNFNVSGLMLDPSGTTFTGQDITKLK